ncbi:MAG: hypothetical protein JNJ44_02125 [Zoogloeaceae bacterium]|nr:hypothetical protein [Zoogloeaceae bacterium]
MDESNHLPTLREAAEQRVMLGYASDEDRRLLQTERKELSDLRERVSDNKASEIVERINAHIASGVRVTRICAECESGISSDELQNLLAKKSIERGTRNWLTVSALKHLVALEKWADDEDEAAGDAKRDYAETKIFESVYGILEVTRKGRSMAAITGPYGIGKTFTAKMFAFDHARLPNGPGAMYFQFSPGTKGDSGVLDAVLNALDPYGPARGNVRQKLDRILGLLKPGDMLIADECGIPAEKGTGLRFLSYLHEEAGIPVAMIGNPVFHAAVWGKRNEYDALASRTRHFSLKGNEPEDVDAFMEWRGLAGRQWKRVLTTVAQLPGRDGGLRAVVAILSDLKERGLEQNPENFLGVARAFGRVVVPE